MKVHDDNTQNLHASKSKRQQIHSIHNSQTNVRVENRDAVSQSVADNGNYVICRTLSVSEPKIDAEELILCCHRR